MGEPGGGGLAGVGVQQLLEVPASVGVGDEAAGESDLCQQLVGQDLWSVPDLARVGGSEAGGDHSSGHQICLDGLLYGGSGQRQSLPGGQYGHTFVDWDYGGFLVSNVEDKTLKVICEIDRKTRLNNSPVLTPRVKSATR